MEKFKLLIDILERLLAPGGCPWDREQTMQSMRHSLVEETFEVVEAIDLNENKHMEEELGDLLFNVIFLCKLAEKEGRFNIESVLQSVTDKLIARHPHVFGKGYLETSEEVLKQWEKIKQVEKEERRSLLDGIPKDLPALARGQKIAKKIAKTSFISHSGGENFSPEEQVGEFLWKNLQDIAKKGIEAEYALRKRLTQIESEFRAWEKE